jgi:hypothetical protein
MIRLLSILASMLCGVASAQVPPFPIPDTNAAGFDVTVTWDQVGSDAAGWKVYTNGQFAFNTSSQRAEYNYPGFGIIELTVTAFNLLGLESLPSNALLLTNPPPLTNCVLTITAWLVLTNPPAELFFALCSATNLTTPKWQPTGHCEITKRLY